MTSDAPYIGYLTIDMNDLEVGPYSNLKESYQTHMKYMEFE